MVLAAGETTGYLGPVVALLCAAGLIGYLSIRLRIVPIVGFLLAGVLIGPHQLGLVSDSEVVRAAADIGVMLLLFTIGIEFSLDRMASIRRYVLLGGGVQVVLTVGLTAAVSTAFGVGWRAAVLTGLLVALSSTAIVLKVLSASGRTTTTVGATSIATLVFQDLAVVVMVLVVPLLGDRADGGSLGLLRALGTALVVLVVVLVVARRVMPPLLERVARTCSPEVFLLAVVAIGLGTAWLTSLAGVSVALGAFLAGLVVSESRHSSHALGEVLPLQILFSAAFFVSIGMLVDLRAVLRMWWLVLLLAAAVVLLKVITGGVALLALRVGLPTAVAGGFLLAQIGEFSFVLQRAGRSAGLEPLEMGPDGEQVLVAVTVTLMILTPALAAAGERLAEALRRRRPTTEREARCSEPTTGGEVLISGWGEVAAGLTTELRARGLPVAVITLGPELAADAERRADRVVRGDPSHGNVLHEAGLSTARLVVICENTGEQAARVAAVVTRFVPGTPVVVRPTDRAGAAELVPAGVERIVDTVEAVTRPLADAVLRRLGEIDRSDHPDPSVPVDFRADPATACPHVSEIGPVLPSSAGCTECLRLGERDWVHLRTCLHCGNVGCCDSSPHRHASAHAETCAHPVVASAEPDEHWGWCYFDLTRLERATEG
ncbi:monovalent cation:H+ antiporter-2, CPA2 family [Actinopolyspora xinjiangensis]|uniref:Monovalent cation:H+ antiporter-2, CPA2 family n=1 Tax=Actinopolyspora xinjiangensis TaxID=405564 RepID=A0A1H0NRC1_9ACTN|nr:cation:proton antiporter [Actinopolyspora xinjiangensis]SDO95362.1 monovalent cation:H+ antiporter-2, CPA2 family [Actinopolyspora xinjiangensis]